MSEETRKKKILILSASPRRDKIIDALIKEELEALGNEVVVKSCMREGRKSVLEYQPDIVILPPIKQPYSRDFCEQIKRFGCAVITRHTEASADWSDFKKMTNSQKNEIYGGFPYHCDAEIVWGDDEAQILNGRQLAKFHTFAVGSFATDIYFKPDIKERVISKDDFCKRLKLDSAKKTLFIASAWGFTDTAPDLNVDEMIAFKKDMAGREAFIAMIKQVKEKLPDWNIFLSLHPGVGLEGYKDVGVPIESELPAVDMVVNCDCLIHSGSTLGVEMHLLNKPAFMYQDQNCRRSDGWFDKPDTALSRVSPKHDSIEALTCAIAESSAVSNANITAVEELEKGRYGKMDGNAAKRAAEIINKFDGKFIYSWPIGYRDYSIPGQIVRNAADMIASTQCGICGQVWHMNKTFKGNILCPWCGARSIRTDEQ